MSDIEEAEAIIGTSGNTFHCKAVNYFREKEWTASISPYYMDYSTNKAREIDLIVEKTWPIATPFGHERGLVSVKLFVECKYIPQSNVFWFDTKNFYSARNWLIKNSPLKEGSRNTEEHHYISSNTKVAKLFASKNKPNIENEVIYKAVNQILNSMVYLRNQGTILPESSMSPRLKILSTIEMPVILCNSFDKFFQVDMGQSDTPDKILNNFQLEVNYAYVAESSNHKNEYFLIDVVNFQMLDDYLDVIERDVEAICQQQSFELTT